MKTLNELVDTQEPAWPMVQAWFAEAKVRVEALPPSDPARSEELLGLQVSTRSPLGAVVYESGGLLVDEGWVRVFGCGHLRLGRSLSSWNRPRTWPDPARRPPYLLVAEDVIGGLFAIDWGGLGCAFNTLAYFSPDTLRWGALEMGYTDWLHWLVRGDLAGFYGDYRWTGWRAEVAGLRADEGLMITPPPFLKDEKPWPERRRDRVPMAELYGLYQDFAVQLAKVPDGAEVVLKKGKGERG